MKKAIVVGAGAGGCAAATELAKTGNFEVTLIEAGGDFKPFAYNLAKFEGLRRAGLFLDERMISMLFPEMRIAKCADMVMVWGRGVGGTTNLATANVLRYDGDLAAIGIDLDEEFAELDVVVPQVTNHRGRWSELTERAFAAFEAQGFAPIVMPKMLDLSRCCNCGHCVLGCAHGGKWTADRLLDGVDQSRLTVMRDCTVEGFDVEGTQVRAARYRRGGRLGRVEHATADLVILAAGGMGTPRLLQTAGISCSPTFFGDPVLCVAAPWEGAGFDQELPMPFVSQRDGYILSPYFDYLSFFFNKGWRAPAGNILSLMIKLADEENGSVEGGSVRAPHFDKPLTQRDHQRLEQAVEDCKCVLEQLGVRREDAFLGTVNAGHPGGALPLTAADAQSLHPAPLPENLYVADSTLFNHSMGNPPILTIMALAKKVAKVAAAGVR